MKMNLCRAFLKKKENCVMSEAVLRAKNSPEFKKRLQWLSEGSLMYRLKMGTPEAQNFSSACEKEKKLFEELLDSLK